MGKLVGNYRVHEKYSCTSASTKTFVGPEVPRGRIAILTFMSVSDYTTNAKKLILGIRDAGSTDTYVLIEQGTALAEAYTVKTEGEVILLPGDRPIGIVETPSTSDVLYFVAHGGYYSLGE